MQHQPTQYVDFDDDWDLQEEDEFLGYASDLSSIDVWCADIEPLDEEGCDYLYNDEELNAIHFDEECSLKCVPPVLRPSPEEEDLRYVDDPHGALLAGIIRHAVEAAQRGDEFQTSWLLSTHEGRADELTFIQACDYLDCNPEVIRSAIVKHLAQVA